MRLPSNPVLADVLLAAVLTGLTVATVSETAGPTAWPAVALGVLTVAPIALRQIAPVLTLTVIAVAAVAYGMVGPGGLPNGGAGLMVGLFTVATLRSRGVAAVMYVVAAAALALTFVSDSSVPVVWSQLVEGTLVLVVAWMLGEGTKRWAQRAERLAAEKAQAVADERVRIARELHDIVAHHMSVISLQAGVAEYVADVDRPAARKAIATVGEASREALLEMRRLLDVLRVDHRDEDADFAPQPGLAQLDDLAHRMDSAGLPVDVTVAGEVRPLPPGPDLCAYRVVQESLTNTLKHAGPAKAKVDIVYGPRMLEVTIEDDGTSGHKSSGSPSAHGIRGMRERAELYGGVLSAGPSREGGFAVKLRLPMDEAP